MCPCRHIILLFTVTPNIKWNSHTMFGLIWKTNHHWIMSTCTECGRYARTSVLWHVMCAKHEMLSYLTLHRKCSAISHYTGNAQLSHTTQEMLSYLTLHRKCSAISHHTGNAQVPHTTHGMFSFLTLHWHKSLEYNISLKLMYVHLFTELSHTDFSSPFKTYCCNSLKYYSFKLNYLQVPNVREILSLDVCPISSSMVRENSITGASKFKQHTSSRTW